MALAPNPNKPSVRSSCIFVVSELVIKRPMGFLSFVTTRIHSTYDGRLCFHRCVSVQLLGGWGAPSQVWMVGGVLPHPRSGWSGVPHPRSGWCGGTPSQVWMLWGVPHPRSGWWGYPTTMTGWVPPLPA